MFNTPLTTTPIYPFIHELHDIFNSIDFTGGDYKDIQGVIAIRGMLDDIPKDILDQYF